MNDVKETKEALDKLSVIAPRPIGDPERSEWDKARHLERKAARAYVELVESGALIIQRDEDGKWPEWALEAAEPFESFVAGDGQPGLRPRLHPSDILDALAAVVPVEAESE